HRLPCALRASLFPYTTLFRSVGMLSIFAGCSVGLWLLAQKLLHQADVMVKHGPLMLFASVLLLVGFNLLAIGLLGEMQVRHYHEDRKSTRLNSSHLGISYAVF